jgi:protein-tyrosine phosphatase
MSIDHIDHGLHISSIRSVQSHETNQYDRIISVCQDIVPQNISDETPYEHFMLADDERSRDEWGGSTSYTVFARAAESVVDALEAVPDEDVLVHCHVGKNRSAAVCAAALAVYEDTSYAEAFTKVKEARPMVNPTELMRQHGERFVDLRT